MDELEERINEIVKGLESSGLKLNPEAEKKLRELMKENDSHALTVASNWWGYERERKRTDIYATPDELESSPPPRSICEALYKMYDYEAKVKKYLAKWLINACYIEHICNTGEDRGIELAKRSAKLVAPCLYSEEQ